MVETMNYKDKRVLVTGARGFVGVALTEALIRVGAKVRALVHYSSGSAYGNFEYLPPEILREIEIVQGDITDPYCVRKVVSDQDIVFHLAALISIPYSYQSPQTYVATNVGGTLNILQACHDAGTSRVIHTSSSDVYGAALYTPIDEVHPLQAKSPYSATKIGAEKMVEAYHRSFSLPIVTVRPFNTYGPRQSARAVIPTIISQILAGQDTVRLGALHPVRDLTFVGDMVDGFMKAAASSSAVGKTINFGTGKGITIGDLALKIAEIMGVKITLVSEDKRIRPENTEMHALIANPGLACDLCDWTPTVSLNEGLQRCIDFVREHPNLYTPKTYQI